MSKITKLGLNLLTLTYAEKTVDFSGRSVYVLFLSHTKTGCRVLVFVKMY